jgi:hypothetical protein
VIVGSPSPRNPFTPGAGYPPPYLAGRDDILGAFERHVANAERLPRHVVLTGLRGTGKTVLLRVFRELATANGWLCAQRELDESANEEANLASVFAADMLRLGTGVSLTLRLRQTGKRLARTFRPKDVEAWGIRYSPAYEGMPAPPTRDRLVTMLTELMAVVRQAHTGLVLLYDEMHEVWDGRRRGQVPLSALFGAIKEVQLAGHPIFVVACGLPPVLTSIVSSRSYLERDLNVLVIDNLRPPDARAAIVTPLRGTSVTFSPTLVDRIIEHTQGYPYFIQYCCSFLIDSVPDQDRFEVDVFDQLRTSLIADLDASFFAGRFGKLPRLERDALLALAQIGDRARIADIPWSGDRTLLRVALGRLTERGQVYRPGRGEVSFTLPLYRDFLQRAAKQT